MSILSCKSRSRVRRTAYALVAAALLLFTFARTGHGQTLSAWSEGPLLGAPMMLSIDTATLHGASGERAAESWFKDAGVTRNGPIALKASGQPDFSASALFRRCKGTSIPSGALPDVDGQSLGVDVLPIDASGHVTPLPGRWAGLVFSVRRSTMGSGGRIAFESAQGGVGADLFHYVYRGSGCIPPPMIGRSLKGNDSDEIRLPAGSEIDGLDLYAALYSRAVAGPLSLPTRPTLYYSFAGSSGNLALVPRSWWAAHKPSGACVFSSKWDGTQ